MNKVINLIAGVSFLVVAGGCGKKDDSKKDEANNNIGTKSVFSNIDITGASQLFVTSAGAGLAGEDAPSQLFKVTSEGAVIEVTYTDDETGEIVTDVSPPDAIYQPIDDYVLFVFGEDIYLTRKSDGAAFTTSEFRGSGGVTGIGTNIYMAGSITEDGEEKEENTTGIAKISASDPSKLTVEQVSAVKDDVIEFVVDAAENLYYTYRKSEDSGESSRLRKANGTFENVNLEPVWISYAGEMLGGEQSDEAFGTKVVKVVDGSDFYLESDSKYVTCGEGLKATDSFGQFGLGIGNDELFCVLSASSDPGNCDSSTVRHTASGDKISDLVEKLNAVDGLSASVELGKLIVQGINAIDSSINEASLSKDDTGGGGCGINTVGYGGDGIRQGAKLYNLYGDTLNIFDEEAKTGTRNALSSDWGLSVDEEDYDDQSPSNTQISNDAIYRLSGSKLWKITLSNYVVTDITPGELLDISMFDVAADDTITISGPKSDGSFSIGTLKDGDFSESKSLKAQIKTFQRIN